MKEYPILILCCSLLLFSCSDSSSISFVDVANQRSKLIDDLESYMTPEEAETHIPPSLLPWKVLEDSRFAGNEFRPPFNVYAVEIQDYSHDGHTGRMVLHFFNNRLMETRFSPENLKGYLKSLKEKQALRFDNKREAEIPPFTKVWISTDQTGTEYVGWGDSRLQEEQTLWIKKYS